MPSRCETCNGKKEVMGLGCMMKKCGSCDGSGWQKEIVADKRTKEYKDSQKSEAV